MVERTRAALAQQGLRVPRGQAPSTRANAAGLTARQMEVLSLVAEGMTNAEIADSLFLSTRTVENHVASSLMKLDAGDRVQAVRTARRIGLLPGLDAPTSG